MSHRDSLMANNSNGNPFELLQTIPVPPSTDSDDDRYAVPKPRTATKTKRSRARNAKRASAPSAGLANGISGATAKLSGKSASPQPSYSPGPQDDDLLGLFTTAPASLTASAPTGGSRPGLTNSYSQPAPNANPFDFFDPLASKDNNIFGIESGTQSRASAQSSAISSARSSQTFSEDELFDPNMWDLSRGADNFFDSEAQKAQKSEVGLVLPSFNENNDDDNEDEESSGSEDSDNEPNDTPRRTTIEQKNEDEEDTKSPPAEPEPPTNCLIEMHRGTALLKYPRRHGFPHFKHVQLSADNRRIQWFSKRKTLADTCINISDVREIRTGQKTETFQKFHQEVLEKASFSVVHGDNYRTFDVVAKSTDECNMWVKSLRKLKNMSAEGVDLSGLMHLDVGIAFKDRNRPKSREGSGNFVRANNSRQLKIDPVAMKQIERDMDNLRRNYARITALSNRSNIARSHEYDNICQVLSELEERVEELTHEVNNTRDTDMSKRDVWRANVDLTAIGEKVEVLLKVFDSNGNMKR